MQHSPAEARIVIVGGGPVGMMLARSLAALGTRSVLINSASEPRWLPKGGTQNARTLEHYRRFGLAEPLRRLGLPRDYPTDVAYFSRLFGRELARISMPSDNVKCTQALTAGPFGQIVEPILRCNQMYVERFVFEQLKRVPEIELRFGWRATAWQADADGVTVEIENAASGARENVTGTYLAACDGGQSEIRRALGIRYGGSKTDEEAYLNGAMVSSHLRIPDFYRRVPHSKAWQYWTINRQVRGNILALDGSADFLFNTRLRSPTDVPTDALVGRLLEAAVGAALPVEFIGHWTWTAGHALVAERFFVDRIALAGDAVHLFTPTGGLGMNTGIDDAANLAWKLAALQQGWGGPKLLPSYAAERRPIALRNTAAARQLANDHGDLHINEAIEEDSPTGEDARRTANAFYAGFAEEFALLGIQLGSRYDDSPIVVSDGTLPPPDDPAHYVPSSTPGERVPHAWLAPGESLFDRLGPGFTLLRTHDAAPDAAPLLTAAARRSVPLNSFTLDLPGARAFYGRDLLLVRPDQHVAWAGNALPPDLDALLATVTGW